MSTPSRVTTTLLVSLVAGVVALTVFFGVGSTLSVHEDTVTNFQRSLIVVTAKDHKPPSQNGETQRDAPNEEQSQVPKETPGPTPNAQHTEQDAQTPAATTQVSTSIPTPTPTPTPTTTPTPTPTTTPPTPQPPQSPSPTLSTTPSPTPSPPSPTPSPQPPSPTPSPKSNLPDVPSFHPYHGPLPPPGKPPRVVVSVTTIPSRIVYVYDALRGVSWSFYQPDAIYVCLPRVSRRLEREYEVPPYLSTNPNITVLWADKDYGPATKLLPVLKVETDPDTLIVTVDDDSFLKDHHMQVFVTAAMMYPDAAIGFGGWNVSCIFDRLCSPRRTREYLFIRQAYNFGCAEMRTLYGTFHCAAAVTNIREPASTDVIEGYEGAAYRRKFFNDSIFLLDEVAPSQMFYVDDVWISGNLALRGVPRLIVYNHPDMDKTVLVPPTTPRRRWIGPSNTTGVLDSTNWVDPNTVDALHGTKSVSLLSCNWRGVEYFREVGAW